MIIPLPISAATAAAPGRDAAHRRPRSLRFSLRTVFIITTAIALVGGYFAWTVSTVHRRQDLMRTSVDHHAQIVLYRGPMYGIKDIEAQRIHRMFRGWRDRASDPTTSTVAIPPKVRQALSPLRRWLGDQPVESIYFTDGGSLPLYCKLFPEAQIVVDPGARAAVNK